MSKNLPELTYDNAWAVATDRANEHMRKNGRTKWNRADYLVAKDEFNRIYPLQEPGSGKMTDNDYRSYMDDLKTGYSCGPGRHWVKSFKKRSGTTVEGHCADNPRRK